MGKGTSQEKTLCGWVSSGFVVCRFWSATIIMKRPISNPGRDLDGKLPGLTSVEESDKASGDGWPREVALVSRTTASGKIRTIRAIGEDSHESGIKIIRLVG